MTKKVKNLGIALPSVITRKEISDNFTSDLARCAEQYLSIVSCPKGRPNVKGYICPHCGYDTSEGSCGGVKD